MRGEEPVVMEWNATSGVVVLAIVHFFVTVYYFRLAPFNCGSLT